MLISLDSHRGLCVVFRCSPQPQIAHTPEEEHTGKRVFAVKDHFENALWKEYCITWTVMRGTYTNVAHLSAEGGIVSRACGIISITITVLLEVHVCVNVWCITFMYIYGAFYRNNFNWPTKNDSELRDYTLLFIICVVVMDMCYCMWVYFNHAGHIMFLWFLYSFSRKL